MYLDINTQGGTANPTNGIATITFPIAYATLDSYRMSIMARPSDALDTRFVQWKAGGDGAYTVAGVKNGSGAIVVTSLSWLAVGV